MTKRIHQVADFQVADEHLAAVATDFTIAPNTRVIEHDPVPKLLPEMSMILADGMNMDIGNWHIQVCQNRVPQLNRDFVVVAAEGEVPQHLKMRQVRSVADETEIVGAETGLQRPLVTTVRIVKTAFETLHPATNEERGIVIFGNDISVHDKREAELLEAASDYIERAKRIVIWLSS